VTDQHLNDDQLIELALGDIADPEQERLLRHLSVCPRCRAEYDAVAATVDGTLPAAPRIEPRPGFDRTTLEAMGLGEQTGERRRLHSRRRTIALAAAAAVLAFLAGIGGTIAVGELTGGDSDVGVSAGIPLRTDRGDQVGVVTPSRLEGEPVLVVDVTGGAEGKYYECRLRLHDGREMSSGDWVMDSSDATWVVAVPDDDVVAIELVTRGGRVWSSARL
jgi:hypothetical protein